jgi:hypothetical protein
LAAPNTAIFVLIALKPEDYGLSCPLTLPGQLHEKRTGSPRGHAEGFYPNFIPSFIKNLAHAGFAAAMGIRVSSCAKFGKDYQQDPDVEHYYLSWVLTMTRFALSALSGNVRAEMRRFSALIMVSFHNVLEWFIGAAILIIAVLAIGSVAEYILKLLEPKMSTDLIRNVYALEHGFPYRQVSLGKRPYDCDFDTPPYGNKHCYYEVQVLAAIRTRKNAAGKLVISYDDRKTWYTAPEYAQPGLLLGWKKIED